MEEALFQTQWGWQIALYLFFGGLAGGTLLIIGLIDLKKPKVFDKTIVVAAWISVVLLVAGVTLLATETLMPLRALLLWVSFSHLGSWMSIGAWLLVLTVIAATLFAASMTEGFVSRIKWLDTSRSIFRILAMIFGLCVAVYTGILLSVLVSHPLWNTWLIPALFTVSAIDTGVALVMLILVYTSKEVEGADKIMHKLEVAAVVLIDIEVLVLTALFASVAVGSITGAKSVTLLTNGQLAWAFWLFVVLCGLVVPFVIDLASLAKIKELKFGVSKVVVAAAACLIGGCALRFVILLAGLPVSV